MGAMNRAADGKITLAGHVTRQEKRSEDYRYLSFEVTPGVARIDVQYDYTRTSFAESRAGRESVLDIGIFSPGSPVDQPLFRGWSGGARSEFFIGLDDATPGYLSGPLPSGTWTIVLGLYRIGDAGCDYTVTITLTNEVEAPAPITTAREPLEVRDRPQAGAFPAPPVGGAAGLSWFVGDLHSHTHHSDAQASVEEIANVARQRGLDFLAVTDHNTISHHAELDRFSSEELLLLPGMEVTTYYGHANVWGLQEWVDFRHRETREIPGVIRAAHAQGALISINHPHSDVPWEYGWVDGFDAIEVWQGLWNAADLAAVRWWDELLTEGKRIVGVGGSDCHQPRRYDPHFPHQVSTPATRVRATSLSTAAILSGVRAGHVTIAGDPAGPWINVRVIRGDGTRADVGDALSVGTGDEVTVECSIQGADNDTLELVSAGEVVASQAVTSKSRHVIFSLPVNQATYIRAQLLAGSEEVARERESYPLFRALTNPVYLEVPLGDDREKEA